MRWRSRQTQFQPQVGQAGKDVIWVPTAQALVDRMLDIAHVGPGDVHFDLGLRRRPHRHHRGGRGATAFGVEFNPNMVALSRHNAEKPASADRATFIEGDLFAADISKATSITLFLLPSINLKLRPEILDLRPAPAWSPIPSTWATGARNRPLRRQDCRTYCRAHFWIVPAKVEGTWKLPNGELRLEQHYQMSGASREPGINMTTAR